MVSPQIRSCRTAEPPDRPQCVSRARQPTAPPAPRYATQRSRSALITYAMPPLPMRISSIVGPPSVGSGSTASPLVQRRSAPRPLKTSSEACRYRQRTPDVYCS